MTATDLAPSPRPSIEGRSLPGKVTGKIRVALDAMVWRGLKRAQAAAEAGLTEHGLYKALRRAPVRAAYLAECEVLRTSGRARRIHRLEEMVEQNDNKAAVINAALALDRIESEQHQRHSSAFSSSPGLVIVVNGNASISEQRTDRTLPDVIDE